MDDAMKYAMKLAMLIRVYNAQLITGREYNAILNDLKIRHKIPSGFSRY